MTLTEEIASKLKPKMDWQQVVLNGGPPCFYVESPTKFCGRSQRWQGHGLKDFHDYISLDDLLNEMAERIFERTRELAAQTVLEMIGAGRREIAEEIRALKLEDIAGSESAK